MIADGIAELVWLMEPDLRQTMRKNTNLLSKLLDRELSDEEQQTLHIISFPVSPSKNDKKKDSKGYEDNKEQKPNYSKCPGCRGHKVRSHESHTRVPYECRFPLDASESYTCPACKSGCGRLDSRHTYDVDCRFGAEEVKEKGAPKSGPNYAEDPRRRASKAAGASARATPRAEDEAEEDQLVPPHEGLAESDPLEGIVPPDSPGYQPVEGEEGADDSAALVPR